MARPAMGLRQHFQNHEPWVQHESWVLVRSLQNCKARLKQAVQHCCLPLMKRCCLPADWQRLREQAVQHWYLPADWQRLRSQAVQHYCLTVLRRAAFLVALGVSLASTPVREQAVQHCQLGVGDSNKGEQARRHVHLRMASAMWVGCGSFPSQNPPSRQMH